MLRDGRYSITSHGSPRSSATSCIAIALRWASFAAILPSRIARLRALSAESSERPSVERTCLTATSRSRSWSRASQTVPMPPPPIRDFSR
ncbi:Uncharacterised protein [Mycobacteroides abscessus subsp. abscessus]|nr:Uncharacterised protein [Mycobacteroides abscessus subsp. abscessus]